MYLNSNMKVLLGRWWVVVLPEGFNVVSTVGTSSEVWQVELDLVPALVKSHGHGADERLHTGGALIVWGTEATSNVLVVEDLDLKGEVLFQL